jgi:hypothetical protein
MKQDRLSMNSLEQLRSIFDKNALGMVLIGMPGIEKRVAGYPQLFSRIGFRSRVKTTERCRHSGSLEERWAPISIHLPALPANPEVIAAVIRLTRGSRWLDWLRNLSSFLILTYALRKLIGGQLNLPVISARVFAYAAFFLEPCSESTGLRTMNGFP